MSNIEKSKSDSITVFYDGSCPLCAKEIGLYQRASGGQDVNWCDVSGRASPELPPGLTQEQAMARFHIKAADNTVHSGGRAFIQLWLSLPGWRWLGKLMSIGPMPAIAELAYRGFLPIRPTLQRLMRKKE
jgi:predicted DCC family thiol-disulfide oxidoreductase YuxK